MYGAKRGGHQVIQECGNNEYGTYVWQFESSTANLTAQRTSRNEIFNVMQFSIRLTRFCRSYKIATLSPSTPIRVPRRQLVNYASYRTPNWPKKTGPVGGVILDIIYHLTHPISQINTAVYLQIIQPLSFYENQDGILPEPESFNALLARRTSYNCLARLLASYRLSIHGVHTQAGDIVQLSSLRAFRFLLATSLAPWKGPW